MDLAVARYPVAVDLTVKGAVYRNQGITDLGRDLQGVAVLEQGGMPYGQLGDLIDEYGPAELPLSGPPRRSGWVVHPPVALAGARALLGLFGSDAELIARQVGFAATAGLALTIAVVLWRLGRWWGIPAAMATLVWVPTFTDTVWIQGNAMAGFGLLAVVLLDRRGRATPARILLGILVAWKPWLAAFSLALPRSRSAVKDLFVVATTAVIATLVVLPFVGGFEALWVWVTEALPGNNVEARATPSNLSWTSVLPPGPATLVYLVGLLAVPIARHRLPRDTWLLLPVALATSLAPFVWDHYWLALAPIVWLVLVNASLDLRVPVILWMTLALLPVELARLGQPGLEHRVPFMVLAGASLLAGTVAVGIRSPVPTSRKG
jgi:hypothetical protein